MFHFQNVVMSATDKTRQSELQVSAIINHLLVVFWLFFFFFQGVVTLLEFISICVRRIHFSNEGEFIQF